MRVVADLHFLMPNQVIARQVEVSELGLSYLCGHCETPGHNPPDVGHTLPTVCGTCNYELVIPGPGCHLPISHTRGALPAVRSFP